MNRHDSGRFSTESLESAAKRYKTLGFSIIPLHGARNPQQPKLPAIKWARFQHTLPSDEELQTWFHDQPNAGIGIVCGRISLLMVLDFDDASVVSEFRHQYPELLNTLTIRSGTRGLPHFYYRLPENKLITTSAYPGVDLRGEGAYVVAPPTRVGKAEWLVENDTPIHAISEFELRRVMRFLAGLKPIEVQPVQAVTDGQRSVVSEFRHEPSGDDLIAHYHQLCGSGRNHALFKSAVKARDAGIVETTCRFILAPVHAHQPGVHQEDYRTRYGEAIRTIASAYKRPPRRKPQSIHVGLGNAAREWLLAHRLVSVARVVDGLFAIGLKANECFTEADACQKLSALKIGRRSIMAALKATVGGKRLFETVCTPLNPPAHANAANGSEYLNKSCVMSSGAKRVKIVKRGRPAQYYRLPSPAQVCEKIGIKGTSGDAIVAEDFASPRTYRQALHRQLLDRRPGHYARRWLDERLGVSRWTTRRYEKAAHIYVQSAYVTQPVSWSGATQLPSTKADTVPGVFLETPEGKRYPAIKGLALKLLKQGCQLVLKHQQANYYSTSPTRVGIPTPQSQLAAETYRACQSTSTENSRQGDNLRVGIPTPLASLDAPPPSKSLLTSRTDATLCANSERDKDACLSGVGIPTPTSPEPNFWLCPECLNFHIMAARPGTCGRCGRLSDWEIISQRIWRDAQALKDWWQERYRDHHRLKRQPVFAPTDHKEPHLSSEALALAVKLHDELPSLSFPNARKIVYQFSRQLIEEALSAVRGRNSIRNPAGFLISYLRSENKLYRSNKNTLPHIPKVEGESGEHWVLRLAKSQYLNFISNADEILNRARTIELSPA